MSWLLGILLGWLCFDSGLEMSFNGDNSDKASGLSRINGIITCGLYGSNLDCCKLL